MKKLIFFLFILFSLNAYSQSPSKFTYQSVVRDGSGKLLSNKEISFRISVLKNSASSIEGKTAYPILPPVHANVFENPLEIIVLSDIEDTEAIEIC